MPQGVAFFSRCVSCSGYFPSVLWFSFAVRFFFFSGYLFLVLVRTLCVIFFYLLFSFFQTVFAFPTQLGRWRVYVALVVSLPLHCPLSLVHSNTLQCTHCTHCSTFVTTVTISSMKTEHGHWVRLTSTGITTTV